MTTKLFNLLNTCLIKKWCSWENH